MVALMFHYQGHMIWDVKILVGGVFGTFFAVILSKAIGTTGAVIALLVIAFVLCVLIFELKPADAISNSIDKVEERNDRKKKRTS